MAFTHALAHLNVARMKAGAADPLLADFVARIPAVNALADAAPGFLWRWLDGADDAGPDPFGDPLLLVNLSLWQDVSSLRRFIYGSAHGAVMQDRSRWFHPPRGASYVVWWIPAGTVPQLVDARARLELLDREGPTAAAFTLAHPFAMPGA